MAPNPAFPILKAGFCCHCERVVTMQKSSRISTVLAGVVLALSAAPSQAVPALPANAAEQLAAADRQFSADGAGDNIADAIGAMLAPNAISATQGVFAHGKDDIVARLRANPANANATAEWAPVRVGIAADGMQGFTYGFMTIHIPGQPDARAKYMSYWVKRPEGWRVFGYKRAGSPAGTVSTAVRAPALPPRMIPDRPSVELRNKYKTSLGDRESAFSDRAQAVGLRDAFIEFGSADAANFGGGSDYVYGNTTIGGGQPNTRRPRSPISPYGGETGPANLGSTSPNRMLRQAVTSPAGVPI
jgi:hypothetical protein